jgi:hypothetical protein
VGVETAVLALAAAALAGSAVTTGLSIANKPKAPPAPPAPGKQARTMAADEAENRRRQQAAAAMGRSSTILTSPLGDVGGPSNVQKKTLLGG